MIERKFIKDNMRELRIKEHIAAKLGRAGLSSVEVKRTPLGEKILIKAARPGMVVGRGGATINQLTHEMKKIFGLQNPQIEIEEVTQPNIDAHIIAESIVSGLERFGTQRFKGLGHRAITDVMRAGALGVEILITGRIPSSRAKRWRFYAGYLKKCGDISLTGVNTAYKIAKLKSGAVGVQVRIMPATTRIPDRVIVNDPVTVNAEEVTPKEAEAEIKEVEKKSESKPAHKKATKKTETKVSEHSENKKVVTKAEPKKEHKEKKSDKKPVHKETKKSAVKKATKKVAKK